MLSAGDSGRPSIGAFAGTDAGQLRETETVGDTLREVFVDVAQVRDHPHPDVGPLDFRQLEDECGTDVLGFDARLAPEELASLAVVVGEALGPNPALGADTIVGERLEPSLGVFTRAVDVGPRVRLVVHP